MGACSSLLHQHPARQSKERAEVTSLVLRVDREEADLEASVQTYLSSSPRSPAAAPARTAPCCALALAPTTLLLSRERPAGADEICFIEGGGFYASVLLPFYASLGLPRLLLFEWVGANKFFNRCARAGLVTLLEEEGCEGAWIVYPNGGYHERTAQALRNYRKSRSVRDKEALEAAVALAEQEGPLAAPDFSSTGYSFIAWWVQPSCVAGLRHTLSLLKAEAGALAQGGKPTVQTEEAAFEAFVMAAAGKREPTFDRSASSTGRPENYAPYDPALLKRCEAYLHTIRDLRPRHTPCLRLLHTAGSDFLAKATGTPAAEMYFHYPYEAAYATLHVHIRSQNFALAQVGSQRRSFDLPSVIQALEAGVDFSSAPLNFWWKRDGTSTETLISLAQAQGRHHASADDNVTLHLF